MSCGVLGFSIRFTSDSDKRIGLLPAAGFITVVIGHEVESKSIAVNAEREFYCPRVEVQKRNRPHRMQQNAYRLGSELLCENSEVTKTREKV